MITKPFNTCIDELLVVILDKNNKDDKLIKLKRKVLLLVPYDNYALNFYHDEFYYFDFDGVRYITFGYDLGGYYILNEENGFVYYLSDGDLDNDVPFCLVFCNTNINYFISFNNLFIHIALKNSLEMDDLHSKNDGIVNEREISALENYYKELDPPSMKENSFWLHRTYELSDGFFPINDSHIKFYSEIISKNNSK